ncbi:hypothetical protein GGR54DRAFT_113084 [Hypoxylon sp. NC1633]|nr:hypothetical protein GGR54DRAFT_113084 [Hypoxylon sp. NC1633]
MSEAQREAKAEAADNCSWRGDSPEPEHDDLAHPEARQPLKPDEVCSWRGDSPEPELDDLAHHPTHNERPKDKNTEKPHGHKKPLTVFSDEKPPADKKGRDQKPVVLSADVPSADNQTSDDKKQEHGATEESLQKTVVHGVQQALGIFQSIVKHDDEPDTSQDTKPSGKENNIPPSAVAEYSRLPPIPTIVEPMSEAPKGKKTKADKERIKKEKEEAKKAEKERKAKEKEEKKRLKKAKEIERKEQRRKEKEMKKNKGKKDTAPPTPSPPPPDLPTIFSAAAEPHPGHHPGCRICEHPHEQGTADLLNESLETWKGLPSFQDLTVAARKFLGIKDVNEPHDTPQADQNPLLNEQELIDHIVEHINKHVHQYKDTNSPGEGSPKHTKTSPKDVSPFSAPHENSSAPRKQGENLVDGDPSGQGYDGNRDWPMTLTQTQVLRSPELTSAHPDFAATQPPSRALSPVRAPTSRCVSPWCEQLGLKMDDLPPFPRRTASWSRRGFSSSPSRIRSAPTPPCLNPQYGPHRCCQEPALYACVPVSVVPALCLETPYCCHYASPMATPSSVTHSPYSSLNLEPPSIAETLSPSTTPRRSISAH